MNLLDLLKIPAALIPGRGTVYMLLGTLVLGFSGGYYVKAKFEAAKKVIAVNEARATERETASIGVVSERKYLNDLAEMESIGHEKLVDLRSRLAGGPTCTVAVPAEWLSGGVPPAPGNAGGLRPTGPPVADAREAILSCERNRLEVSEPNAKQIDAIQHWYRDLRERFNR